MCTGVSMSGQSKINGTSARPGDRHVDGKNKRHRLLQIVENAPARADRFDDGGEIVIEQHQRGGFARHVGAAPAHGDADMGGFERRRVVDAVAGHGDDLAVGFERFDESEFLLRQHAGEDRGIGDAAAQVAFLNDVRFPRRS